MNWILKEKKIHLKNNDIHRGTHRKLLYEQSLQNSLRTVCLGKYIDNNQRVNNYCHLFR